MKKKKDTLEQIANELKVKDMIKSVKEKGKIKSLEAAFKENPVEEEKHKGNANYF